ncbi:MAG: hypothetical protein HC840_20810 [Leptolyngbyaceae cyanobacterium RM2_2_4]|nr:hypothetical protein [Leptolyngbyaceae cyanobacterium RM2_2_4]
MLEEIEQKRCKVLQNWLTHKAAQHDSPAPCSDTAARSGDCLPQRQAPTETAIASAPTEESKKNVNSAAKTICVL